MILLDTSGLLSALFADQRHHRESARALLASKPPRILSPFVLAELDYLIQKYGGIAHELLLLEEVARGAYELAPFDTVDLEEASRLIAAHRDLGIGLADASLVVLAGRYQTREILTLDQRHFRALRPPGRRSFRILPADL